MKMSDAFDTDDFNIMHQAEIVDTSKYAYIEHNEIQIEGEAHINHAVRNHDRMMEEIAELKGALREARGALSACSIQESRNDGSENRMKIKALDKQVYEIDSLLAKLNQEGEE